MNAIAATRPRGLTTRFRFLTGYRELLLTLLRRDLRAKYKGSVLGVLWSYLTPLLLVGVYTLVFSVLWRAVSVPHYPLFVLTGLVVWRFFQGAVQVGASSLVTNAHIITKVWFPREIVPVSLVLSEGVGALVMFAVVVPAALIVEPANVVTVWLAIPFLAAFLCLTLGLTWILSTLHVFFRDVEHVLGALFLPWFFLTPVFYALDQVPGAAAHPHLIDLLRFGNPVTPYVEAIRGVVLQATIPGPVELAYVLLVGPAVFFLGLSVVQRYEDRFAIEL